MYQSIQFCNFQDAFVRMDRNNNFSYEGKKALFDYLESYEEDTGEPIELDVIALCVEYTEYDNVQDYLKEHDTDLSATEFDSEDEFLAAVKEEISDNTTLIEIEDSEAFIIQDF